MGSQIVRHDLATKEQNPYILPSMSIGLGFEIAARQLCLRLLSTALFFSSTTFSEANFSGHDEVSPESSQKSFPGQMLSFPEGTPALEQESSPASRPAVFSGSHEPRGWKSYHPIGCLADSSKVAQQSELGFWQNRPKVAKGERSHSQSSPSSSYLAFNAIFMPWIILVSPVLSWKTSIPWG